MPQARPAPRRKAGSVPRCWLMTDARNAEALANIAARMPPRSAIVIRAFALPTRGRTALIRRLRHIARARGHMLIWSGTVCPSGYDGRHGAARRRDDGFLMMPVHDPREAVEARRHRADAVLVSPVHHTRSHPGAPTLKVRGFARLAKDVRCQAIGLGGMDAKKYRALRNHGACGWAAIDGWMSSGVVSR